MVFCLGSALAGAGGIIGGPILSAYPGLDADMLPLALIVVMLGGRRQPGRRLRRQLHHRLHLHLRRGAAARPRLRDPVPADDLRDRIPAARAVRKVRRMKWVAWLVILAVILARPAVGRRRVLHQPHQPDTDRGDLRRERQPAARLRRAAHARPRRLRRRRRLHLGVAVPEARARPLDHGADRARRHDADGLRLRPRSRCARPASAS